MTISQNQRRYTDVTPAHFNPNTLHPIGIGSSAFQIDKFGYWLLGIFE